jgi:hypothetical protein
VLADRVYESHLGITHILRKNIKLSGFYAYAELSFNDETQLCELHNQTMTLSIFYEV